MDDLTLLGPLAPLVGTWEGDGGVDFSYHHAEGSTGDTPYRERTTLNGFGPVDNGTQVLYGLDYRMAAWRGDEVDPFHTEVGYWLWDAEHEQVMRCFMVPRGTVAIAGGTVSADATEFRLDAENTSNTYGVLENQYLAQNASTVRYEVKITVNDDGTWSYASDTVLRMAGSDELLHHTDHNTLHRGDIEPSGSVVKESK
jgi:hypothetical protein